MKSLPEEPSLILSGGFVLLAIFLVGLFAYALKSPKFGLIGLGWLAFTGWLAHAKLLADFSTMPPRVVLLLCPAFIGVVALACSPIGKRVVARPLAFLIGFQSFRIVVELLIHRAVHEGIAPPQMTWSGMNLDILTGITAVFLLPFLGRLPRWSLLLWNSIGLGLLVWVVAVAALSMPGALQKIRPDNVWVAFFPFVWLPTVAVAAALLGHIAVYRKLLGSAPARP